MFATEMSPIAQRKRAAVACFLFYYCPFFPAAAVAAKTFSRRPIVFTKIISTTKTVDFKKLKILKTKVCNGYDDH